jgi:hypothetical protein
MTNRSHSLEIFVPIVFVLFAGFFCSKSALAQEHGDEFVIGKYLKMNSKILNEERTIVVNLLIISAKRMKKTTKSILH